ncbi:MULTISPECIES: hypothetical protein [Flavobacterium]|uniref:hypothetical protein n=1 Tax=Flavobacterium TaxID=237 RepID=UPI00086C547C|nr:MULTISPECIES: hypothetical protein [Flavobacterium]MBN9283466.1 hypothetical protein [Flavobacterium sp.]ODS86244.1 MAG: hypothetical protein ABS44_13780 [Chryseobacterium sp. SCN 40-13]OJV69413.1 MAG: hypothetical protein BGO42_13680 [Flavobacterium sp. 40-81]
MNWPKTIALSELDKLKIESATNGQLRKRLLSEPEVVFKERGIDVPAGVSLNVVEDTDKSHTFALLPFVGSDLSKAPLQKASNASTWECTTCTPTSPICAGSLASLTCA